jgi:hypothetical protein
MWFMASTIIMLFLPVASMTYKSIDDIFLLTLMIPKVIGFVALGVGCVLGFNEMSKNHNH